MAEAEEVNTDYIVNILLVTKNVTLRLQASLLVAVVVLDVESVFDVCWLCGRQPNSNNNGYRTVKDKLDCNYCVASKNFYPPSELYAMQL